MKLINQKIADKTNTATQRVVNVALRVCNEKVMFPHKTLANHLYYQLFYDSGCVRLNLEWFEPEALQLQDFATMTGLVK